MYLSSLHGCHPDLGLELSHEQPGQGTCEGVSYGNTKQLPQELAIKVVDVGLHYDQVLQGNREHQPGLLLGRRPGSECHRTWTL